MDKGDNKINLQNVIGIVFGLLFIASAVIPVGPYHSLGETNITGVLWNFMLPTGWLGIAIGVGLLLNERIGLNDKQLAYGMFAVSLLLLLAFLLQDVDYFLSFWHGINTNFDVNSQWFLAPASAYLGIFGSFTSLLLILIPNHNTTMNTNKVRSSTKR
jgi:hypothetical protein